MLRDISKGSLAVQWSETCLIGDWAMAALALNDPVTSMGSGPSALESLEPTDLQGLPLPWLPLYIYLVLVPVSNNSSR